MKSNEELAFVISNNSKRFDGFAMLPSNLPEFAARVGKSRQRSRFEDDVA